MALQPNDLILNGKYRIDALIGEGAFAQVYRATHLQLQAPRALKILRHDAPGVGSTEFADYAQRFQLEAQLGAKLNNQPHIIQVHDFERDGEMLILVMEYASGGSLANRIDQARKSGQPIPIDEVIRIALEVADGLAAIHALDVVHRDLKPSNILFDAQGRAKIADLGLAQVPGGPSMRSRLSQSAPHPGTPAYMSPEQITTTEHLSPASDVYAMGAVLFETLTGRVWRNIKPGTLAKSLQAETPDWLNDLLGRMLTKDNEARPWDGSEVAQFLQAGISEENAKHQQQAVEVQRHHEAEAKRGAELKRQQQAAEEQRQREIEVQAQREAGEKAKHQAELKQQLLTAEEQRRREVAAQAKREAEERAQREAQAKAKRVADERAQREVAEKANREAKKRTRQPASIFATAPRIHWGIILVVVGVLGVIGFTLVVSTPRPAMPTTPTIASHLTGTPPSTDTPSSSILPTSVGLELTTTAITKKTTSTPSHTPIASAGKSLATNTAMALVQSGPTSAKLNRLTPTPRETPTSRPTESTTATMGSEPYVSEASMYYQPLVGQSGYLSNGSVLALPCPMPTSVPYWNKGIKFTFQFEYFTPNIRDSMGIGTTGVSFERNGVSLPELFKNISMWVTYEGKGVIEHTENFPYSSISQPGTYVVRPVAQYKSGSWITFPGKSISFVVPECKP